MPPKIDMGDSSRIHDTGPRLSMEVIIKWKGFVPAELLLKEDKSVQMIRREETLKDYFGYL